MDSTDFQDLVPITATEEKQLKRVHDMLCDYLVKTKLEHELINLQKINDGINNQLLLDNDQYPASSMKALKVASPSLNNSLTVLNTNEKRIEEINNELDKLNKNPNKKISVADLSDVLKSLNQKVSRQEVEEMIWECDEDLDNGLNWKEFKLMYCRNNTDKTGLEPSRMVIHNRIFYLKKYLLHDVYLYSLI